MQVKGGIGRGVKVRVRWDTEKEWGGCDMEESEGRVVARAAYLSASGSTFAPPKESTSQQGQRTTMKHNSHGESEEKHGAVVEQAPVHEVDELAGADHRPLLSEGGVEEKEDAKGQYMIHSDSYHVSVLDYTW